MESTGVAEALQKQFPGSVREVRSHRGQLAVFVNREPIVDICRYLKEDHLMNHLNCLCGVDNLKRKGLHHSRFEVVYQLYSIENRVALRLNALIPDDDPSIDSVTDLWTGADWLERETWDLVGIRFNNHPGLERILMPSDWQGHPLRKEYPLRGDVEWQGLEELRELAKRLSKHDFHQ
ncbi:MAG: NADH-quinone oxidoreductase subunit C [Thermodesulfobacteriota bacterium]